MEIYPNEMKYSLGFKFDSKLFFIIRNISNYISSKGNYLEKTDEIYGNTLLLIAASCWDYGRVKNLLNKGYDFSKLIIMEIQFSILFVEENFMIFLK